ncbi:MAG: FkbM family methyltransferase [Alphaproteobacteria bacterium]|nr:FkbM family methyltransferase [Alphaproteobacteria bacterium]
MTAWATTPPRMLALRSACAGLRLVFRHAPWRFGKQWLWDRVVRPHILWRNLPIEARTRFGARLEGGFPDAVHAYVYFFGVWEPAVTALFRQALRPGDVVIDIGANVGLHSMLAARLVGPRGHVHAIEASPWIHARLRRNLAANGVPNVTTYNMATTAARAQVPVFLHDATNLGGTTILADQARLTGAPLEAMVEGRPVGEIIPEAALLAARLIKIDVEGAEWLVLQGLREWLPRLRADVEILVEVNSAALAGFGATVAEFLSVFSAAGFVPHEVRNGYGSAFYIEAAPGGPAPLARGDFDTADLLFRRTAP